MSIFYKAFAFLVFFVVLLRWILLPLLFARLTQFRVSSIGIFGARELEYRSTGRTGAIVPNLRIERIGWAWGGLKEDDVGLLILRINGVSLRIQRQAKDADPISPMPRSHGRIAVWRGWVVSNILHLLIHHYPSLARIISIQISDIRLIFDDLDGIELTVKDFRSGVKVNFEGHSSPTDSATFTSPETTPTHPQGEFKRANPLLSPGEEFSPPASPFHQFSSFSFPNGESCGTIIPCPTRLSRMAHAKRRASVFQTRMSTTATQVWSRATGRAYGSVSFIASLQDIAVILPHSSPIRSMSAAASAVDLVTHPHPHANGMSHRVSTKSLNGETEPRPRSFASVGSFHSLLAPKPPTYALPPPEGGFERLVSIEGRSQAVFDLGFGPKKGLMGEDTLRTDVQLGTLRTSVGAIDKVQDIIKAHIPIKVEEEPKKKSNWTPRAMPRIILRAFESVSVSLAQIILSHYLPTSSSLPVSTSSSLSDMTELSSPEESFTVSLNLSQISCKLDAADSSNNQRARNAFGTNPCPESKVRGIGFLLKWNNIGLQCLAPGEKKEEMTQLVEVRMAEFEGLTTWRPSGWSREELRFASDPNLAVVIGKGVIASIDVAGDVQLLDELKQGWKNSRPESSLHVKEVVPAQPISLPPRVRFVLDVGHAMILVADRISEHKTTLTLASDGFHLGCYTNYSDVIARRRDKPTSRAAFKQEDELRSRREEAGEDVDYALPATMLKPQLRRNFTQSAACLQDDYSISMRTDALLALEPMSLHMTLTGKDKRSQQMYHLATVGRAHGTLSGDILGRQEVRPDGSEVATLEPDTLSCGVDLGIDSGVKLNLWNMPVVNALCDMAHAHRVATVEKPPYPRPSALSRLPSGISARVSLGLMSVFIGYEDPNPNCKLKLTRGLWIQTTPVFEYAFYNSHIQAMQCRHSLSAPNRSKLRLPEDITTQALAFYNHLSGRQGRAALVSCSLVDTFVKPIFNGKRFTEAGGTSLSHEHPYTPKERQGDHYVGWEFRRPQPKSGLAQGQFANAIPPMDISDTDQATRPLLRIPHLSSNWLVQRTESGGGIEHKVTSRIANIEIVCDMSHIYCALLAALAIRKIVAASKKSQPSSAAKSPLDLSIEVSLPSIKAHFAFPLREHLYVYVDNGSVSKPAFAGFSGTASKVLAFVPSAREIGSWEELARIKQLEVLSSRPDDPPAFWIDAEALRVRIPVAYQLSKLVLNINVTVKAIKLLLTDLGGEGFSMVKKPIAEQPKRLPPISFNIQQISLEAKDDPIETNLNLIWRAGMAEQDIRNSLEDAFEQKVRLIEEAHMAYSNGEEPRLNGQTGYGKLTDKAATSFEDARYRLDWWKSRSWTKRIRAAKQEQRRREQAALRSVQDAGLNNVRLPITIVQSSHTAPLFRAALSGVKMSVSDLGWSRAEIIDYMGKLRTPFDHDVEFSLMVPLKLSWTMDQARATLRDYPLPLIRIPPTTTGDTPAWSLETPFVIAEELSGDDSMVLIPCEVVPKGCGAVQAQPFTVQIAKTIMPVKTYTRAEVNIASDQTTEFTWGNSYQPAIQDFMKVMESLSHPPRDPSPRVGFWDKFRLILHWKVAVNFAGNVHLHLKGSYDPYSVMGYGAGFALAWKGGTKLEINQPNEQYETIQISSKELLIAIPDLTALHDHAALGSDARGTTAPKTSDNQPEDSSLISRRYTKPCARFLNGVRVGFGFVLERTCRAHNCQHNCGETENLLHRQCRMFDFRRHQDVILRSPEVLERDEERLRRAIDSYEGFRSDYIHFSVSVVAPLEEFAAEDTKDADKHNSLHFSPKAFAHFFHWWKLFDHSMSLPIRQGRLFPDSPPPSKKFGRSLGTIKYRFDLAPVYLSHMYPQVSKDLFATGKAESLGIKARFNRFRADAHQRAQEKTVRHEKLHRTTVVVHKPFYAADLLLDGIELKGVRADFAETSQPVSDDKDPSASPLKASGLPKEKRAWYNFFDFIDADRKPFDKDPELEVVDVMDCPQMFFSKRVKARQTTPHDDDSSSLGSGSDSRLEIESSKFGHEKSHICYLGAAAGVGPTQIKITQQRIAELEDRAKNLGSDAAHDLKAIQNRLRTLYRHLQELSQKEDRHIDDDTFEQAEGIHPASHSTLNRQGEVTFENTFHVHCPRVFYNNTSRNILYKYWFSSRDRKREEYTTSHASLRGVRDGMQRRMRRLKTGFNQDDIPEHEFPLRDDAALDMLRELQEVFQDKNISQLFRLPADHDVEFEDLAIPSLGLPADCVPKPQNRFLVLKPQIALRSEAGENAIVLLTVEEISFRGFRVLDEIASDAMSADVLNRNYVSLKGLQAFYPTEETMCRETGPAGMPRGLDFVPLEIFLDVRSEATDYDRIVLKADAALHFDKFNQLRMPRGLEWPDAQDMDGKEITHLRLHQDHTTVIVPRLTVSATSKHYNALYTVVTDLLLYQDPEHRQRSDRIDNFIFSFDRKDRDPQRLLMDIFGLQHSIRMLTGLQRGYEANVDLLSDEGKVELFKIRTDLLEATEQLFTVFEAIAINQARDDARAALKSASRMNVRVGGIAWHMLQDNLAPLVKLDIEGTIYSWVSNKDGSNDSAVAFGDLSALNSDAEALYPEVLVRYESSASHKRRSKETFASACWSIMAPVGGITIVRHLAFYIHPVRFRLEEKVGHAIVDYIFSDRVKRRNEGKPSTPKEINGSFTPAEGRNRSASSVDPPPLSRTRSQVSVASLSTNGRDSMEEPNTKFQLVPTKDAAEMRRRATANKTFVKVIFGSTSFVLSYKTDDTKKHRTFSMPDCVDFKIKTPEMAYSNKIWGYEDVFEHVKRDIRSYAWSQTGDLLSQIVKKTSLFRSKKNLKHLATLSSDMPNQKGSSSTHSPSRLRYTVEPPTPLMEESATVALARALSKEVVSPLSRSGTRSTSDPAPQILGVPISEAPSYISGDEAEAVESEKEGGMGKTGKTVKGLFGKLKKHTTRLDTHHSRGSVDELSSVTSPDRNSKRSAPSLSPSTPSSQTPSREPQQLYT